MTILGNSARGSKRHIFIGGLHKSGTSLLHRILRSHPAVSGFKNTGVPEDEGQHLQRVFLPATAFGGPGRFGFDPASHMDENHLLATQESADRLFEEWGRYWDLSKNFLVEKSPPNLVRTRFLQKLFPNSYFIVLLRHPIAIAIATQKWRSMMRIPELLEHSLKCYETFFADARYLNHVFVLRYEDLVLSPHTQIERLLSWVGLEAQEIRHSVRNDNEKYFSVWSRTRADFLGGTSAAEMAQLESGLNLYGYSLDEPMVGFDEAAMGLLRAHDNSLQARRP